MIASNEDILNQLTQQFEELQSNLDCYLNPPDELHGELISSSKTLYDLMKNHDPNIPSKNSYAPKELLTRDLDNEQVWQQLQLNNNQQLKYFRSTLKNLTVENIHLDKKAADKKNFNNQNENTKKKNVKFEDIDSDLMSDDEDIVDEDEMIDFDEDEEELASKTTNKKYKSTIVDDNFFKLRQMEEFLNEQDRLEELKRDGKEKKEDDESDDDDEEDDFEDEIDMFGSEDDDER